MKKKTMSIGGATYDLFVRVPHTIVETHDKKKSFTLPLGEKVRVEDITETCGGGACNTSVGLARLGQTAYFEGVFASDQWGEKLMKNMQEQGVNTQYAMVVENEVSSFSIILSASSGERVILYEQGTNTHLHEVNFDKDALPEMDWIYLNHIHEEACDIQDDIVQIIARREKAHLTWNPGGCQISKGIASPHNASLLKETDILLVNKEEAFAFTGTQTIDDALRAFIQAGVDVACITDGSNGTVATDGKNRYHCPILTNITVLDTTGAGDAFGTGLTWAFLEGMTLPESLRAGTINAASVVAHLGAQAGLLTDIEMREKLKSTSLDVANTSFV